MFSTGRMKPRLICPDSRLRIGVATRRDLSGHSVRRSKGLPHAFTAELLFARMALVALLATVDHASDGNEVADLIAGDVRTDR
jgi:hypothetical protein